MVEIRTAQADIEGAGGDLPRQFAGNPEVVFHMKINAPDVPMVPSVKAVPKGVSQDRAFRGVAEDREASFSHKEGSPGYFGRSVERSFGALCASFESGGSGRDSHKQGQGKDARSVHGGYLGGPGLLRWFLSAAAVFVVLGPWGLGQVQAQTTRDRDLASDAAGDRGLTYPRAATLAEGDVTVNLYEFVFLGTSYGLTDDTEVTAMFSLHTDFAFIAHLKHRLLEDEDSVLSLSLRGAMADPNFEGGVGGGVGLLYDRYIGSGYFSLHGEVVVQNLQEFGPSEVVVTGGLSRNVEDHLKLMIELSIPNSIEDDGLEFAELYVLAYGFRIHWSHFAFDLSFIRTTFSEEDEDDLERLGPGQRVIEGFPLGIPFVTFNGRY